MRHNAARRTALLNAAIEILAREGARGLTYRALDAETDFPTGTASNYFRYRAELLTQVGKHIHARLQPGPEWLADTLQLPARRELLMVLLQNLVQRVLENRSVYLALLELRLEATRRPELQSTLFQTIQTNLHENQNFSLEHGIPLSQQDFTLLYLAISGLLVEELTLPGVLEMSAERVVTALLERLWPSA